MEIFDFQSDCGMAPGAAMLLGSCAAPKPPGFIVAPMLFVPFLISFAIFLPRSFLHKKRKKEEGPSDLHLSSGGCIYRPLSISQTPK
jgi:hypothetical protein